MMSLGRGYIQRSVNLVHQDLKRDPYLRLILLVSLLLSGFWIWYRVPNFASPDEYSRLIDPMKVAGRVVTDPNWQSFQEAVSDGRALGATFYLYGLALVPVFIVVLVTGSLGQFAELGTITSRWTLWQEAPAWFWTSSIIMGRIIGVILGLGCVYLVYRLGLETADRQVGRIASTLFVLSLGYVSAVHELGEDVPMVLLMLLTLYLANRYVRSGSGDIFLIGCATGGLAIAFKLTGGAVVGILGLSLWLRATDAQEGWRQTLIRPKLIGSGLLIGGLTIYIGLPSVLVQGPEPLVTRILHTSTQKATQGIGRPSIWYQLLQRYLNALGWPLFLVAIGGLGSFVRRIRSDKVSNLERLILPTILLYLLVFSQWNWVRMHHILPTIPLILLLGAISIDHLYDRNPSLAQTSLAIIILSSAVYAGIGVSQYATEPRSQATSWLKTNAADSQTVEVYENSIADVGVPHESEISRYSFPEENATYSSSLVLNESAYTQWMVSMPARKPDYIQLTHNELEYLDGNSSKSVLYPRRSEYMRMLMEGRYDYEIAVSYGQVSRSEPWYISLLFAGIEPEVEQRAERVIVLRRL